MIIFFFVAVGRPDFVFPENVQKANAGIAKPSDYKNRALASSTAPFKNVSDYISKTKVYATNNVFPIALVSIGVLALGITAFILIKKKIIKF